MAPYPTLKIVKALLETHQLAPRKRLGQNFLVEGNIARKSLVLAGIEPGDQVVEIGPGFGALTQLLLDAGCHVYTIEKDAGLTRFLESELSPQYPGHFHLMSGDAMDFPLASMPHPPMDFKIVANLPYAISTPWIDAVLSGPLPSRMVLMLQKEAANRYMAQAGTGNFGPISIFLNSAYQVDTFHSVSAHCFYPKPDVGSALLSLVKKQQPVLFPPEIKDGIRQIFRQRRKQISSILSKIEISPEFKPWLEILVNAGLKPETRPEAIPLESWQQLTRS